VEHSNAKRACGTAKSADIAAIVTPAKASAFLEKHTSCEINL